MSQSQPGAPDAPGRVEEAWAGGGEMGARMRALDWTKTPLGPTRGWPQSLKTALSLLLECRMPMYIAWGAALTQLYNDGYRAILGPRRHPLALGRSSRETFADRWELWGPLLEGVRTGRPLTKEGVLLPLDGDGDAPERRLRFSSSPVRDESGGVGGVLVTVADPPEQALGEQDRARSTFFSNVSHALRTPLTLMLGPAEDLLAGRHGPLAAAQREQVELLHRSSRRLQRLVDHLLDFSRIEAGRVRATCAPVDLAALTRELVNAFRPVVERAGLSLTVDAEPLPAPVYVDREMWEKIVLNLLSNALKFTFEGGIRVSLRAEEASVALRVTDSGVGIPPEELPHLFERFHPVEGGRARAHDGSGIGLMLTQELARLHGGGLTVQSALGVGSTFTVTLPQGAAHLPPERLAASAQAPGVANAAPFVEEALRWSGTTTPETQPHPVEAAGRRARILLVDDHADLRRYMTRLLEPRWSVEAVEDGVKALAAAWDHPPDLVVTDAMMPELDGFGLVRALRAHERTHAIPIVMLSARVGEGARMEGLQAGADDYLTKPFSARELVARIGVQLELARLRGAAEAERAKLRALFLNAPAFIALLKGPWGVIDFANELFLRLGRGREVIGRPFREVFPELERQGFFELLDQAYRTGERAMGREAARILLTRAEADPPEEIFINFVFQPELGPEGQVEGVSLFGFDVTAQAQARAEAQAARERLDFALDAAGVGHWDYDLTTRTTRRSLTHDRIFGYDRLQPRWDQETFLAHVVPSERARVAEACRRAQETAETLRLEFQILRPDGERRWLRSQSHFKRDAQGRPVRLAGIVFDHTAPRQAALERDARMRELAETVRFSELFVGVLGHDLRNPLAAITLATEMILTRPQADEVRRPLSRVLTSAKRMDRLIGQILDFTRARLGPGIPLQPHPAQLAELCKPVLDELRVAAGISPDRLQLRLEGDVTGSWDEDRLAQVVSNLVGNAIKHGRPDRPILISLHGTERDAVALEVHNEGVIAPSLMPTLFEPFRRGGAGQRSSGLGLGLFIAREIVEAHGGTLEVRSSEREGTSFIARLPRQTRVSLVPPPERSARSWESSGFTSASSLPEWSLELDPGPAAGH